MPIYGSCKGVVMTINQNKVCMVQEIFTMALVNFKSFLKIFYYNQISWGGDPPTCLGEFLDFLLMIEVPFKQFVAITMSWIIGCGIVGWNKHYFTLQVKFKGCKWHIQTPQWCWWQINKCFVIFFLFEQVNLNLIEKQIKLKIS
jgi:hypothetical protein